MPDPINGMIVEIPESTTGNFSVTLDQSKKVDVYGHTVTPLDAIVMRGIMPDNNVASLKCLNAIGEQLAFLERQDAMDMEKAGSNNLDSYYRSLPTHIAFARDVDKAINAHTARILQIMGSVEQNEWPTNVKSEANELQQKITEATKATEQYIADLKFKYPNNPIVADRIKTIRSQLNNEAITLNTRIAHAEGKQKKLSVNGHQRLFRIVLESHESLGSTVSAWQGNTLNRSVTEGYQDAATALQNHLYSVEQPTDTQLHRYPPKGYLKINTLNYPKMSGDELLFVSQLGQTKPMDAYKNLQERIIDSQKKSREESAKTPAVVSDDDAKKSLTAYEEKLKSDLKNEIAAFKVKHPGKELTENDAQKIMSDLYQRELDSQILTLPGETPIHLHEANDLFSALAHAGESISYFFAQAGAKQPGITLAFLATAATFGSAALIQTNTLSTVAGHVLDIISTAFSKATAGKLSALQIKETLISVESHWAGITHADDSLMKRLLVDCIAAPALMSSFVELLVSNRLDKTTASRIIEAFKSDPLLYQTDEEKMAKALMHSAAAVVAIGGLLSTGFLINYICSLPALPGFIHAPLHMAGSMMDASDPSEFEALMTTSGYLPEVCTILSALFTIKATALVGGKMYLVGHQMAHENEDPAVVQRIEALSALYILYNDDQEAFNKVKVRTQTLKPGEWEKNSAELRTLKEQRPELFKHMKSEAFWNNMSGKSTPSLSAPTSVTSIKAPEKDAEKPGLLSRFGSGVWNKLLGPPIGALYTVLLNPISTLFASIGNKQKYSDLLITSQLDKDMLFQAKKMGRFLLMPVIAAGNSLKMVTNSLFRGAFLGLKSVVAAGTYSALCVNAIANGNGTQGFVKGILGKVASMATRAVIRLTYGVTLAASAVVRTATGLVGGILPAAAGAVGLLGSGIAGGFYGAYKAYKAEKGSKWKAFKTAFSATMDNPTINAPLKALVAVRKATGVITKPFQKLADGLDEGRKSLADWEDKIEGQLMTEKGAESIIRVQDAALTGLNKAQSAIKNWAGSGLNRIATFFRRGIESTIQKQGYELDQKEKMPSPGSATATATAAAPVVVTATPVTPHVVAAIPIAPRVVAAIPVTPHVVAAVIPPVTPPTGKGGSRPDYHSTPAVKPSTAQSFSKKKGFISRGISTAALPSTGARTTASTNDAITPSKGATETFTKTFETGGVAEIHKQLTGDTTAHTHNLTEKEANETAMVMAHLFLKTHQDGKPVYIHHSGADDGTMSNRIHAALLALEPDLIIHNDALPANVTITAKTYFAEAEIKDAHEENARDKTTPKVDKIPDKIPKLFSPPSTPKTEDTFIHSSQG